MDENNNNTLEEQKKDPAPEEGGSVGEKPAEKTDKNAIWFEVGLISFGELVVNLITVLVFALLDKLDYTVITGALLGTAVTILNFFILTASVDRAITKYLNMRGSKAMDDEEAEKFARENSMVIQNAMTRSYIIRSILMLGVLVGAFLLKQFNVIATLVPLVCYRPIIYVSELIKKRRAG